LKLVRELLAVGVFTLLDLQPEASLRLLTVFPTGEYVRRRTLNLALVTPFMLVTLGLGTLYVSVDDLLLNILVGFGIAVHCALSVEDAVMFFRQLSLPPGAVLLFDTTPEALDVWVFEPAT
jgi:hypothetical protein